MRNQAAGFSLVEIIIVMALFSILATIGTLQTRTWLEKGGVESEIMLIYGELMAVRQSAMNFKRPRAVVIRRDSFQIYSTAETSVGAVADNKLRYPLLQGSGLVAAAGKTITFDERGFTNNSSSFCVEPAGDPLKLNSGAYDSIVISGLRLKIAKRTAEGAPCTNVSNNIQLK